MKRIFWLVSFDQVIRWIKGNSVLLIVSFALLMESVDTTVLNTAIPMMAKSFDVNPIEMKFALISYLLSLAIFIPISGWVAEKFGIKKVFISAIALFTLSSLCCGLTVNLPQLILARMVQGLGGSLTMPVGRLVILKTYARHELISKISVVVMVGSIGMMLGPLIGGVIVNHFSWRWIFWVNVPIGFFAVLVGLKALAPMPKIPVPPLDKLGFVLFGAGLATLTYGLSTFSESSIALRVSLFTLLIAGVFLASYILYSKHKKNPIIKVDLLLIRTFQVPVLGNLMMRLNFGGLPFLLPLLLQLILGFSPQLSGILLAPIALGILCVKPISFRVLRHLGFKTLLLLNTLCIASVLFFFSTIGTKTSIYTIALMTYAYGFLISLHYTGMNSLAYANVEEKDLSAATSIMSTIQQLAISFGIAFSAILLSFYSYELSAGQLTLGIFQYTFVTLFIDSVIGYYFFSD